MSKKSLLSKHLDRLFDTTDLVLPDPVDESHSVSSTAASNPPARPGEAEPGAERPIRESSDINPAAETASLHRESREIRVLPSDWSAFLDGIQHNEHIGFTYDHDEIQPAQGALPEIQTQNTTKVPLVSGQDPIGALLVESGKDHPLTSDEEHLIANVTRQVGQHLENLRLVAEADRFRREAEQSARRLTRQGWDEYLDGIERGEKIAFSYNRNQVSAVDLSNSVTITSGSVEIPLKVSGEPIGAIHIEREENQEWTAEDEALTELVSRQLTQQIENLRLLARAEHYRRDAEAAARRLTLEGWNDFAQTPNLTSGGFAYDQVAVRPYTGPNGDQPALTETLKVRDTVIGSLSVVEPELSQAGSADLVSVVAQRLSLHIESLRLLDETERSRQQLNRRANELETVAKVSTAAATILTPVELAQAVVDLTQENFRLYHSEIYLIDKAGEKLDLIAGSGQTGRAIQAESRSIALSAKDSLLVRAIQTRADVVIADVTQEPSYTKDPLLPDTHSELLIPMVVGDRVLGIFALLSSQPNQFAEEERRIYTSLAAQIAVSILNANLYSEQSATVERLRELDQMKSSFLANMSHELRTPLNSILGFTQLILEGLDGPVNEGMESDLRLVEKNSHHLLNLINDILDMAKIEAGRINLVFEPTKPQELLKDVINTTSALAREKSLYLELSDLTTEPIQLQVDGTRLRQVLINLVGNSIKFTETGGITLQLLKLENAVQIRIIDTGIGIPANKLETIFEPFSQVNNSTTRKVGGTGLGLSISRRLVELHHGKLWATSSGLPGEGSIFYVELPLTVDQAGSEDPSRE